MTVTEVQAARDALALQISALVQNFEQNTGCVVHSIPVMPAAPNEPVTVRVKVQIP